jgi:hypothetical protein
MSDTPERAQPIRIWALHCPFNKRGFPVLGNMGSEIRGVVIIPVEQWTALCKRIPELGATQFEVGEHV